MSSIIGLLVVGGLIFILAPVTDPDPPVIHHTEPFPYSLVKGNVLLEVNATDEGYWTSGIKSYEIYIDNSLVATTNTYNWDVTGYSDGSVHTILYKVYDKSGNLATHKVVTVVDNHIQAPRTEVFKIVSYNIWESGRSLNGVNGTRREKDSYLKVLKEEDMDIAVLIETGSLDDSNNTQLRIAMNKLSAYHYNEAPYIYGDATKTKTFTDGEAIMSRYPIVNFTQIEHLTLDDGTVFHYHHQPFDAVVDINGIVTHIIGYHGKCCQPSIALNTTQMRENETEGLINYMDSLGKVPIMFMGDFNSFSPDDVGDLAPMGNLGAGPLTMLLHPDDPVYGKYSSHVHNFTDVFRTLNPDDPGYSFGEWEPQYWGRIDFIIVNQFWADKMINSTVGDTPSANLGSDHYDVDACFSLDPEYHYNSTNTSSSIAVQESFTYATVHDTELSRLFSFDENNTIVIHSTLIAAITLSPSFKGNKK